MQWRPRTARFGANIVVLDRILAAYGEEARPVREALKKVYASRIDVLLSGDASRVASLDKPESIRETESFLTALRQLTPQGDMQRTQRDRAVRKSLTS